MSALGLRFVLDTNAVDDESAEMAELRQIWRDGWIELARTDTVDTELTQRKDPEHRARLLSLSGEMIEQFGPMIPGHSRLGFCVLGSDQEAEEWDRLWEVMFPGRNRAKAKKNDVRDALHVATAIRYGMNALVTSDKGLLKRADLVKAAFNGFLIMAPAQALAFARRMLARDEYRTQTPRRVSTVGSLSVPRGETTEPQERQHPSGIGLPARRRQRAGGIRSMRGRAA